MQNENILFSAPALRMNIKSIELTSDSHPLGLHLHNEVEIIRVDKGKVLCTINGKKIHLNKDNCIIINSRSIHSISYFKENSECTYLQIDMDSYIHQLFPYSKTKLPLFLCNKSPKQYEVQNADTSPYNILYKIEDELKAKKSYYDIYIKSQIFALIAFMFRNGFYFDINEFRNQVELAKILPAIEYIEQNFDRKLSLEDISRIANINKFYFCKIFKSAVGANFTEYIAFLRVHNAEIMLLNTNKNISEIAFECGFNSIQYFNKTFKKIRLCTPKEYRKLYLASN